MSKFESDEERRKQIHKKMEELRQRRRKWVDATRDAGFNVGINNLLTQLYPDNAHFIYELLQNAEDTRAIVARFKLTDLLVKFEHDGERLFSFSDVESITSIGNSTKRDEPTSIGKFGVGFKAVFAYTNTPEIHSGDFHFRIHDLVVPETEGVPRPRMGVRETRFVFPFDNPKKPQGKAVDEIKHSLRALGDNTLLFLSHIRKIEYLLPGGALGTLERIEQQDGRIEIRASQPGGKKIISHWLLFDKDVKVTDEDGKRKACRIAIAYSLAKEDRKKKQSKWKIVPLDHGQVSIYFPAEKETSNLRFHIHAPFASTVARDSVRDCKANQELRDHLAELVVESLATVRDRGMLDVSFLAVLPNPADNLPNFYEPIREAIVEAFREQDLTPTRSGEHKPAGELYRGPAKIAEVLGDEGISILTNYAAPLWAANAPQENQREDRFLQSLDIDEWGWSELASSLEQPHPYAWQDNEEAENAEHKERIETFIQQMSDAELMRFYALLGEAVDAHDENIDIENLRIIRVTTEDGDEHVTSGEAYLLPENNAEPLPDVLFVKSDVYSAGRSPSQKKFARSFLETVGVRVYDEQVDIEKILEMYRAGHLPSSRAHINHIRQFVVYWSGKPNSIETFKSVAFLNCDEEDGPKTYCAASDLYLDLPYIETGLAALFNDNKLDLYISKPKKRLSDKYHVIRKFEEFVVALGVMTQLEIRPYKATEMQKDFFEKIGRESSSTTDEDYFINGFHWRNENSDGFIGEFSLDCCKSMALSRAIWRVMCGADPEVLTACYVPNQKNQHKEKSKASWLVDYLAERSWVPDKAGNFLRPTEITDKTLHPDFKFDDRNGWLTAIKFGENVRKQSEEYRTKNQEAQSLGFESAEELDKWKKVRDSGISPDEILAQQAQRPRISQPEGRVDNSARRREKVLANTADAPSKESIMRERTIQEGITKVAAQAKAYLRTKYTNTDGQLVCQCCHEEMPFKVRSDVHYFEAVQCIGDKKIRHFQNRLALCPTCAAMYQYARETDDAEIRRSIVEHEADDKAPAIEIPVRLASRELTLRFVGTHWFDLKTVLSQ